MRKYIFIAIILIVAGLVFLWFLSNKFQRANSLRPVVNSNTRGTTTDKSAVIDELSKENFRAMKQSDRDFDGISDENEVKYNSSPTSSDTDQDGLLDSDEINLFHTNPRKPDTDDDRYSDSEEIQRGYNPLGPGKLP